MITRGSKLFPNPILLKVKIWALCNLNNFTPCKQQTLQNLTFGKLHSLLSTCSIVRLHRNYCHELMRAFQYFVDKDLSKKLSRMSISALCFLCLTHLRSRFVNLGLNKKIEGIKTLKCQRFPNSTSIFGQFSGFPHDFFFATVHVYRIGSVIFPLFIGILKYTNLASIKGSNIESIYF